MIQFLAEWALRSSILIACGALLLAVVRVKDSSIRLAAWTAMLAGSTLIPGMAVILPAIPVTIFHSQPPAVAHATQSSSHPVSESFVALRVSGNQQPDVTKWYSLNWPTLALIAYALIAALILIRLLTGLLLSLRLLHKTHPSGTAEFRESAGVNSPVTIGLIRPVIVLPADWPQWESAKLRAVLAHETAHVLRHDPLVQVVSAVHRAALWFSPLSWLLHSRIVAVAEEASDDAAVIEMGQPAVYAELLLDFMRRPALHSRPVGIPMARYGRPDRRIQRILNATSFSRGLTRWSIAGLVVVATPLTWLAAVSKASAQAVPPIAAPRAAAAPQTERPKFDAASIKPCDPDAAQAGARGGQLSARFRRTCVTVKTLIQDAYIRFGDGTNHKTVLTPLTKIEGGPAWINSDQYTIEAESEEPTRGATMGGPMMQTLLEDRFRLRTHRETREGPIYELTIAKGGSKLSPVRAGPCVPSDLEDGPPFLPPPDMPCQFFWTTRKQPNVAVSARNTGIEDLTAYLTRLSGRLVVDKTGITGKVDFKLVYSDGNDSGAVEFERAPIFTAIQEQLGLKLEPARGPREYLIIDSISRPSSN